VPFLFCQLGCITFNKNLGGMSHNVPAVYDVFAVAIKETVGFLYRKNVAEKNRTKGVARLRFFGARAALAAKHIQTC
jgi:hypothetical protein